MRTKVMPGIGGTLSPEHQTETFLVKLRIVGFCRRQGPPSDATGLRPPHTVMHRMRAREVCQGQSTRAGTPIATVLLPLETL